MNVPSTNRCPVVLLVEDNASHAALVIRCLQAPEDPVEIHHVSDGETALDYLMRCGRFADPASSPRPHVVLLDLRLPRIDGFEVLRRIRQSPPLCRVPVVVLTTSQAEEDMAKAYRHQANSFLGKPADFDSMMHMMRSLRTYWFRWNQDPWLEPS